MNRRTFIGLTLQAGALAVLQSATGCKFGGRSEAATLQLPALPFAQDALAPYVSARSVSFHYGKHHRGYVDAANRLAAGTRLAGKPLETIVTATRGRQEFLALFRNAAQVYNHNLYWQSMSPQPDGSLIVTFEAQDMNYAASTIMSYGPLVEVLEPEGLRQTLHEWASAVAEQYQK